MGRNPRARSARGTRDEELGMRDENNGKG